MSPTTILGETELCGTYLLRIQVTQDIEVRFGRFQNGAAIPVSAGEVVYAGSAMARTGSMTLARRILRHAARSAPRPPHSLLPELRRSLLDAALAPAGLQAPPGKKLHWNVDFLLDDESVHLRHVYIMRSRQSVESQLAAMLLADPVSSIIAPRLGAHDHPAGTHLLRVGAGEPWWLALPQKLYELLP